ncbi:MAG: TIGR02556 family CRISPR-associated protein [Candidatus Wallbacteria bacterium]
MLNGLFALGKYCRTQSGTENASEEVSERDIQIKQMLDILPKQKGDKKQVVVYIKFKKDNNEYFYEGVGFDEFDSDKTLKYLYKKISSRGGDATFISKIADISKTFNRIFLPMDKICEFAKKRDPENCLLKIKEKFILNKEIFEKARTEVIEAVNNSSDKCELLTIKIIEKDKEYYINELNFIKEYVYETCVANDDDKYFFPIDNMICCVCGNKTKIFGVAFPFKIYTIDQPGFITGGFNEKKSGKNLPICGECADNLKLGRKFAAENLRFTLCGLNYLLLPKFLESKFNSEIIQKLQEKSEKLSIADKKDYNSMITMENEIFDILGDSKDYINSTLLFFDAPKGIDGSVFKILLMIEDILPSRFKKLYIARHCVEKWSQNYRNDGNFSFNFKIIKDFFKDIKEFLEVLSKVFYGHQLDFKLCVRRIMEKSRENYAQKPENNAYFPVLNGFSMLKYFFELNLFKNIKGEDNMQNQLSSLNSYNNDEKFQKQKTIIEDFFMNNKEFFNNAAKKSVFLIGALAKKLLNIQNMDRNATPFYEHLKGLKMNEKDIIGLLPKIQNKLRDRVKLFPSF